MIGRRYQILSELGSGGMGTVYRATDRLTDWTVALKQVGGKRIESTGLFEPSSDGRLALAREFRLMASLRHPHIISVLDYGFDESMRPYYTMDLLESPLTLLDAGCDRDMEAKIVLLVQTLQALAYLHRRGVVHRDIKPSNVLVGDGRVRLVDFGISELRERIDDSRAGSGVSGSVPYLAPEVLQELPAGEPADLYALGVMAYQLLSGRHPYEGESPPMMMVKTMREPPMISTRDFDARVIPVLERLLAKDPVERYNDAAVVIRDLATAVGLDVPEETAVRDSYLQSASFVGRGSELEELTGRLGEARRGRGSIVLVAGESGVGKSRLLDELRSRALVDGALVLSGQAVNKGGRPYHLWRDALRWLCLLTLGGEDAGAPEEALATVLKPHVSDLEELLGYEIADAPELEPQAGQRRFVVTVEKLIQRLEQPAVVLLEDLHWAGAESLGLLAQLELVTAHLPLLLVGTYRDDERPELPKELEAPTIVKLERLSREAIAELSASMLGEAGRAGPVVDLLERETSGNAFFLVEVARSLAEDAGRLDHIDPAQLPEHVSTGGIERAIRHRLRHLPRPAKELLELAAVAGRSLDLRLLEALGTGVDLDGWLKTCADAAVLEVERGYWRFVHDRLREILLHGLSVDRLRSAHRRVAVALLECYGDTPEHVTALSHHWTEAADPSDIEATGFAVDYLERAGRLAMENCANQQAEQILNRGLQLHSTLVPSPERQRQEIRFQVDLGATYLMSRTFSAPEVGQAFSRARILSEQTGDKAQFLPALLGLWRFHVVRGELDTTRYLAEEMVRHAEAEGSTPARILASYAMGTTLLFLGDPGLGAEHFRRAIELFRSLEGLSRHELAAASFFLGQHPAVAALAYSGWALWCLGYPDEALALNREAVELADDLKHPFSQSYARTLVTWLHMLRDDPAATREAAESSIALAKELTFPYFLAVSSIFHGWARARLEEAEAGIGTIRQVLEGLRQAGSELFRPFFLALLADACREAAQVEEGLELIEEALEDVEARGAGWWEAEIYRLRGELSLKLPDPDREGAENAYLKALHRARWREERSLELRATISLVRLWQDDKEHSGKARQTLRKIYESFTEGHETPDLVTAKQLLQ